MNKSAYIKAEYVNGSVSISSGGKGIDVLMLSALTFCNTLNNRLKEGLPEGDRLQIAYGLIDDVMAELKTADSKTTTINLPPDWPTTLQ